MLVSFFGVPIIFIYVFKTLENTSGLFAIPLDLLCKITTYDTECSRAAGAQLQKKRKIFARNVVEVLKVSC